MSIEDSLLFILTPLFYGIIIVAIFSFAYIVYRDLFCKKTPTTWKFYLKGILVFIVTTWFFYGVNPGNNSLLTAFKISTTAFAPYLCGIYFASLRVKYMTSEQKKEIVNESSRKRSSWDDY